MSISKKHLEDMKKMLLERKQELEQKLAEISKERVSDGQVQDPGDQALSSTLESLRNSWQDTELEEYNRVVLALEKIDDGTYGVCVDCNEEISERRLKSYPNAARCLVCQEAFEERQS